MCWNPAKRTNEDVSSWGEKFVCAFLGFSSCVYTHTKKYLTQRRIRQCKFWMALHRTRKERNDKVWYLRTMISQVAKRLIYLSSAVFARNFLVVFLVVCFFSFFFSFSELSTRCISYYFADVTKPCCIKFVISSPNISFDLGTTIPKTVPRFDKYFSSSNNLIK